MSYLVHTAHLQFLGLMFGVTAGILTAGTSGANQWRVWHVDDRSVITSGVAWVGVWRACFYSHVLDRVEFCTSIRISDPFVPAEIAAAQVLLMVAVLLSVLANTAAGYALRCIYFGAGGRGRVRRAFASAGALCWLTAACSLVPAFWNMSSVLANRTIEFPPEFHFPPAPLRQDVGVGIGIGIGSALMFVACGLVFLCYRYPIRAQVPSEAGGAEAGGMEGESVKAGTALRVISEGMDNAAYQAEEEPVSRGF